MLMSFFYRRRLYVLVLVLCTFSMLIVRFLYWVTYNGWCLDGIHVLSSVAHVSQISAFLEVELNARGFPIGKFYLRLWFASACGNCVWVRHFCFFAFADLCIAQCSHFSSRFFFPFTFSVFFHQRYVQNKNKIKVIFRIRCIFYGWFMDKCVKRLSFNFWLFSISFWMVNLVDRIIIIHSLLILRTLNHTTEYTTYNSHMSRYFI